MFTQTKTKENKHAPRKILILERTSKSLLLDCNTRKKENYSCGLKWFVKVFLIILGIFMDNDIISDTNYVSKEGI